jgi:hypothetical protein
VLSGGLALWLSPAALTWLYFLWPGVFTECYRKDEERAQKLLVRVSEAWGKTTCLQLALEAKDMKFVSHGGIQVTTQNQMLGLLGHMQTAQAFTQVRVLRAQGSTWCWGTCCWTEVHILQRGNRVRQKLVAGGL